MGEHIFLTQFAKLNKRHAEVLQCLLDCFFFIRRTLRLFSVLRLRLIVILSLDDTALLLYLCDIQAADF